jgi:zinc D-Ala-D-Ala carboxypeptidase
MAPLTGRITEHFLWAEVVKTEHRSIENVLPDKLVLKAVNTAKNMERIRALLQSAIIVNSWYRSPELNQAIGGSLTSQHMKAEAVDFISPYGTSLEICKKILKYPELIKYDQLILEHSWVHVSFSSDPSTPNRMQVLSLLKSGGYAQGLTDKFGRAYG